MIRFECNLCGDKMFEAYQKTHLRSKHRIFRLRHEWSSKYFTWRDTNE